MPTHCTNQEMRLHLTPPLKPATGDQLDCDDDDDGGHDDNNGDGDYDDDHHQHARHL